jgi:lipopolysaccharide transport system ATP-binding protein
MSVAQSEASSQFEGSFSKGSASHSSLAPWDRAQESQEVNVKDTLLSVGLEGPKGIARIEAVGLKVDGQVREVLLLESEQSELEVSIQFMSSKDVPIPNVAVIITDRAGRNVSSCSNFYDKLVLARNSQGQTQVSVRFPKMPLLRGRYGISVFLLCERAIHIYDSANVGEMEVSQRGLELGVVALPRHWSA